MSYLHTKRVQQSGESDPCGNRSSGRTEFQQSECRKYDSDAHDKDAADAGNQIGIVRRQMELRLQVLGHECVQAGNRQ